MKDSLKQFLGLLLIGQLFLIGAGTNDGGKKAHEAETTAVVAMAPASSVSVSADAAVPAVRSAPQPVAPSSRPAAEPERLRRKPVELLNVTHRMDEPYQALDFDFSGPVSLQMPNRAGKLMRLRITPPVGEIAPATERSIAGLFESFRHFRSSVYSEFVFAGKGAFGDPVLATGTNGLPRLTVLFRAAEGGFPLVAGETLAPGVTYYTDRPSTKSGPSDAHILRIDPLARNLAIFPVLANEGICQKEVLSSMAKRYKAIAGINAAYFTPKGDPIGTLIIDRRLISSPLYNRSVFGLARSGQPLFGNPDFSGALRATGVSIPIDAVNQPRSGDQLVVYTPEYARSTMTTEEGVELVLIKGRVIGIHKVDTLIPPDGVVVSAGGEKAAQLSRIRLAQQVKLDYQVNSPWNDVQHAVCGGPRLMTDGRIDINGKTEKFDPSIQNGRHPRTAVALTATGELLFIVVDGRSKRSAGMTLAELASYVKKLGGLRAINLDGGGSSSMFIRDRIVNRPSDGKERPISNGILITTR
ncbi:MAG TPA: phosphodiester glycosidase family protein [Candidatus Ozemobacteraceae bacterium]